MADKPILFSAPMILALLAGRKTQTRRTIKPQPYNRDGDFVDINIAPTASYVRGADNRMYFQFDHPKGGPLTAYISRINVGDRLYVREHWRTESRAYDDLAPSEMGGEETILYEADADWSLNKSVGRFRQGMHMPRWTSRLTLIVEDVKIERLQDISREDAVAEGMNDHPSNDAICDYSELWEHINGAGSWASNPWVVAYRFTCIPQNIDQIARAA